MLWNTSRRRVFSQLFRVLPNFHQCFYNSIETRSTYFLFLLENSPEKARALIGYKSCLYNSMETQNQRAVDVVMTRSKRIYILIIKVNKLFSFLSSRREIENMYSVFLSSYTNTRESLGELEKAVETLACGSCSHSISRSPKLPLVFV